MDSQRSIWLWLSVLALSAGSQCCVSVIIGIMWWRHIWPGTWIKGAMWRLNRQVNDTAYIQWWRKTTMDNDNRWQRATKMTDNNVRWQWQTMPTWTDKNKGRWQQQTTTTANDNGWWWRPMTTNNNNNGWQWQMKTTDDNNARWQWWTTTTDNNSGHSDGTQQTQQ